MSPKFFTVAEAEALLPRLEEIFQEIAGLREEIERRMDKLQLLDALWGSKVEGTENPDHDEFVEHQKRVRSAVQTIERRVEHQILELGVRFPQGGLDQGLIDFPTRFEGRTVYLCWQWGEEGIVAWHEVEGGFRGRRPLTAEQARRMGRGDEIE